MKKLSRRTRQEEQLRLSSLQSLASQRALLEQAHYLPKLTYTIKLREDGTPVIVPTYPKVDPGKSLAASAARANGLRIALAKMDEPRIRMAEDLLQSRFEEDVAAALQGLEADDLAPFLHHVALRGPTLLTDPHIVVFLHDWWRGAQWGNEDCARKLDKVWTALAPGSGRWRTDADISQDEIFSTYKQEHAFCQKAKEVFRRSFRNPASQSKILREKFQLSTAEIEEVKRKRLTPSAWAVKRTARRLNLKPERVRRILLEKTRG